MKKIFLALILVLMIWLLASKYQSKDWTLMVCKIAHSSGGCAENSYVLEGYKKQADCMEKGIGFQNPAGFECGYNCRLSDGGGLQVCDKVCNERGCH